MKVKVLNTTNLNVHFLLQIDTENVKKSRANQLESNLRNFLIDNGIRYSNVLNTNDEVKFILSSKKINEEFVQLLSETFSDYEASTIDGVRVRFTEDGEQTGWYLARKSNTEPILVMRVEANNEENLSEMLKLIDERISPIINIEKLLN